MKPIESIVLSLHIGLCAAFFSTLGCSADSQPETTSRRTVEPDKGASTKTSEAQGSNQAAPEQKKSPDEPQKPTSNLSLAASTWERCVFVYQSTGDVTFDLYKKIHLIFLSPTELMLDDVSYARDAACTQGVSDGDGTRILGENASIPDLKLLDRNLTYKLGATINADATYDIDISAPNAPTRYSTLRLSSTTLQLAFECTSEKEITKGLCTALDGDVADRRSKDFKSSQLTPIWTKVK